MERNRCQNTILNNTNVTSLGSELSCSDNVDGRTGRFGKQLPCGYCDANCVYNAIEIAFIIGVVANALVVIRVIRDRKLRDPTFIGIAALALPDLLFLSHNLIISFETVIVTFTCRPTTIVSRPWYIMNSVTWFSANSHVALLAIIRYITIAYPIKSTMYLTTKRVLLMSVGVWVIGIILLGNLAVLISLKIIKPGTSGEFIIIWWITVYLIPLIVTTILHLLKIFIVKKATKDSATRSTRRSIKRMGRIVPLVIVMATVLPLPKLVYNCIRSTGNDGNDIFPSRTFKMHFKCFSHLVYMINHFINPFIYGFLSKKFRNSLKDMLPCIYKKSNKTPTLPQSPFACRRQRISSTETISRNLSSISSISSIEGPNMCQRVCSIDSDSGYSRRDMSSVSSCDSEDNSRINVRF